MRSSPLVAASLLVACHGGDPWDEFGPAQPGVVRIELGDAAGLTVTEADIGLSEIAVDRCEARPTHTLLDGTWWVVPPAPLAVDGGPWCWVSFGFDGPLVADATGDDGAVGLTLELPPIELELSHRVRVDGDPFVLRLGRPGWLDAEALGLDGGDLVVGPGSSAHDDLVDALVRSAGLYRDDDDGVLTERELARGPLTTP